MRDQLFVGGQWTDGELGGRIPVFDPATGETITEVADGTPADAAHAVEVADAAQQQWAHVAPRERAEVLRRCWSTLLEHQDEITHKYYQRGLDGTL